MRKYLAILLALAMVFAFAACGGEKTVTPTEAPAPAPTEALAPTEAPAAENPETPAPAGALTETEFWTGTVPESLPLNEDYSYVYPGYSYHDFSRVDAAGTETLNLSITVEDEATKEYRKNLVSCGFSLDDQAAGKAETVSIGGLEFVSYRDSYWFEDCVTYIARPAGSGKTVTIQIYGEDVNDPDAAGLLDSLQFSVPDVGFVEAPYPKDGQPYLAETGTAVLNGCTLTAQQLIADDSFLVANSFDNRVAVVGDLLYALSGDTLRTYTISDGALTFRSALTLGETYEAMSVTEDGRVFLTNFMAPMMELKDGDVVKKWADVSYEAAVSPDGSFAISFFTQPEDLQKYTLNADGTAAAEPFVLSGGPALDMVTAAYITENYVGLNAYAAEDNWLYLFVYDHEGNFVMQLKDEAGSGLGSVTAMIELDDKLLALDGNLRDTLVWTKDGVCLGAADDGTLYGSAYPWMSGLCRDGKNVYVSMVDERPDGSWDEMIFYRLRFGSAEDTEEAEEN